MFENAGPTESRRRFESAVAVITGGSLALDADCVVHMSQMALDPRPHLDDICRILESGKNVVTTVLTDLIYPSVMGPEVVERLETACKASGVSYRAYANQRTRALRGEVRWSSMPLCPAQRRGALAVSILRSLRSRRIEAVCHSMRPALRCGVGAHFSTG